MLQDNTKATVAAAAGYATGQRESIGSSLPLHI